MSILVRPQYWQLCSKPNAHLLALRLLHRLRPGSHVRLRLVQPRGGRTVHHGLAGDAADLRDDRKGLENIS